MNVLRLTRYILLVASLITVLIQPSQSMAQQSAVKPRAITVKINEMTVYDQLEDPHVLRKNRLYVPVGFFEHSSIQANIMEDYIDGTYSAILINHKTHLIIDSNLDYYIFSHFNDDNEERAIGKWGDSPPFVDKGKLMIPLRAVAEALGLQVEWDNRTRTATLISDKQYRDELESKEDWEEWMGEKPMDEDDASGAAITDEELNLYFKQENLFVIDYEIVSKYTAVVSTMNGSESLVFAVERLKNGGLGYESAIGTSANEEGISVHRTHGFVSIVVYESAKEHEIEYCVIKTFLGKGEVKEEKLLFEDKQGFLVRMPEREVAGTVTFYGKNGFIHESRFW